MKSEKAYLKKLAYKEIEEDEFYEREIKFSKKKKTSKSIKKNKNSKWDNKNIENQKNFNYE